MKEYNGKVRVVFKNMVVHPQVVTNAQLAPYFRPAVIAETEREILVGGAPREDYKPDRVVFVLDNLANVSRARFTIRRQLPVYTAQGRFSGYELEVLPIEVGAAAWAASARMSAIGIPPS